MLKKKFLNSWISNMMLENKFKNCQYVQWIQRIEANFIILWYFFFIKTFQNYIPRNLFVVYGMKEIRVLLKITSHEYHFWQVLDNNEQTVYWKRLCNYAWSCNYFLISGFLQNSDEYSFNIFLDMLRLMKTSTV